MANTKSAEKRVRQNRKRAAINKSRISRIKTFIKKFEVALSEKNFELLPAAFSAVQSEIQRGVTKGVMHKNTAARKISRLNAKYKAVNLASK